MCHGSAEGSAKGFPSWYSALSSGFSDISSLIYEIYKRFIRIFVGFENQGVLATDGNNTSTMISIKNLLMGTMAAAVMLSCAQNKASDAPFEECVYLGDKTEFAVWSPDAEAAELRLYNDAKDETA